MQLGGYRLLSQLGAGRDGVWYQAEKEAGGERVEVHVLAGARGHSSRWSELAKRLKMTALLSDPSARRLLELGLEYDPPYVVMEGAEVRLCSEASPTRSEAVAAAAGLARGMAEAHRLGLTHGRLVQVTISGRGWAGLKLDWSGLHGDDGGDVDPTAAGGLPVRAPSTRGALPNPADDVYALGERLAGWLTCRPASTDGRPGGIPGGDPDLVGLIDTMRAADPVDRPSAREVAARLAAIGRAAGGMELTAIPDASPVTRELGFGRGASVEAEAAVVMIGPGSRLGRFQVLEKLGEGGMGAVYRALDSADGSTVAIKVLHPDEARRPRARRRFAKEARLLAEVNNPYVTNLVEVNEDGGIHYLVLEFVAGMSLAQWLKRWGRLDESTALGIMADVARALDFAHGRGIVHRDIKPENILIVGPVIPAFPTTSSTAATLPGMRIEVSTGAEVVSPDRVESTVVLRSTDSPAPPGVLRVKLSDFGLARHVVESESLNMTQAGAIIGTPLYMAPEQCSGRGQIGPETDVYAMGVTLFHLLAGRPPFVGETTLGVIAMHQNEPPPSLRDLNASVSDGVGQIVAKALAKRPEGRYADAGEMLLDLERLLRGEPTGLEVHPRVPDADPRDVICYDFRWELDSSPRALWPHVSNTERLNRAVGLPPINFTDEPDPEGGVRRLGRIRKAGIVASWREHPFEWVEGRRMGVFREFHKGPLKWFVSILELTPRPGGGTTLAHSIRVAPRGILGRAVAAVEIGMKGHRGIDRVYRRIDAMLTGKLGHDAAVDPFEPPAELAGRRRRRLDDLLDGLGAHGIDPIVVERLGDFLARAPAQEVARIRPLALARRLDLDADQVVAACLHGAADGALMLLWDILCPVCRIPSQVVDTLRALREHGHCRACAVDFELDFANSVELIFRVHPEIRETEQRVFCIGGPSHSPHVVAQARVGPGERLALDLELDEGSYQLRGPQLAFSLDFRVEPGASSRRLDLSLIHPPGDVTPRALSTGGQSFSLSNEGDRELVVRIERTAPRADALTAARASALGLFRELFPGEALAPGQLVNLAAVALVVTELDGAEALYREQGDARAFALVQEQFRVLDDRIRREGGALVKTVQEGIVAVFSDTAAAVRSALALGPALAEDTSTRDLTLRVGVHRGPAMVATLNDHLDYFGTTVHMAARLPGLGPAGSVILSPAVASDPVVAALLGTSGFIPTVIPAPETDLSGGFAHRLDRSPDVPSS